MPRLTSAAGDAKPPSVSVVIATYKRPTDLARCLPSVLADGGNLLEVIVADQSDDDRTEMVVAEVVDPRVRFLRLPNPGKTSALNVALGLARGSVIAFTDDDCVVSPGWLTRALTVLDGESDAGIVFGTLSAAPHDPMRAFVPTFTPLRYRRLAGGLARPHRLGVGANMVVRRAVFERIGLFRTDLGPGARFRSAEECDLAFRALRHGFAVIQDPDNAVTHWGARTYADGAAMRLIADNYFGIGAFYGSHVRGGSWYALVQVGLEVADLGTSVVMRVLRKRRPTGARRLANFVRGIVAGARTGAVLNPSLAVLTP